MDECKKCKWFKKTTDAVRGECRAALPVITSPYTGSDHPWGIWPVICQNEWCGHFEPKRRPA